MTIDEALGLATADAARGVVTIPGDLHGFPGHAHGGAVAAVFHRLALPRAPVRLQLISLFRTFPAESGLLVGDRQTVRVEDEGRGRYCRVAGLLLSQDREPLASAQVRFAGSPGVHQTPVGSFLETTDLQSLSRAFPSAAELGARRGPA